MIVIIIKDFGTTSAKIAPYVYAVQYTAVLRKKAADAILL